jgi:hypothetical protein
MTDHMTAAFGSGETCMSKPHAFNFASEVTVCFGITSLVPTTIGRTTRCRLCFFAQLAFALLEFCLVHHALLATYGELYKRGRPLRKLEDQVGVVVFNLVDSLYLRISHESPFFAVALQSKKKDAWTRAGRLKYRVT